MPAYPDCPLKEAVKQVSGVCLLRCGLIGCGLVEMATLFGQPLDVGGDKHSIVDDFMYGSNVASSHIYIRLGILP